MILKFEHRVLLGYHFQKEVFINMDNVFAIEILRTRIIFNKPARGQGYYWVPRTEYNMKVLNDYLIKQEG